MLRLSASQSEPSQVDAPLRGVALSDSPVLIRSDVERERVDMASRLHALGRRKEHPLHVCNTEDAAAPLFDLVSTDDALFAAQRLIAAGDQLAGTWALGDVGRWPKARQELLGRVLEVLDEHRLNGRLPHERIPRVIVMEPATQPDGLDPELQRRLAFFELSLGAAAERPKRAPARKRSKTA